MRLECISCVVATGIRATKSGFVREGVLRKSVVKDGQLIDQVLYALVR